MYIYPFRIEIEIATTHYSLNGAVAESAYHIVLQRPAEPTTYSVRSLQSTSRTATQGRSKPESFTN